MLSARAVKPGTSRGNNFDALRLVAATTVLVLHCWPVVGQSTVPRVHGLGLNAAAVMVFFVISGFLLAQSWTLEPRLGRFLAKRALRIYPALILVLVLSTFVLGPVVTTLPVREYLSHPETWGYLYNNLVFETRYSLPGVFPDNPIPLAVNGPLWTLSPEVRSYAMLALVGLVGFLRSRVLTAGLLAVLLVGPELAPERAGDLMVAPLYVQCFAIGSFLYVFRQIVPWHWAIAAGLVAAWLVVGGDAAPAAGGSPTTLLAALAIPYTTIFLAYNTPKRIQLLTDRGDLSYGIYIWGSPVQETVQHLWGRGLSPLGLLAMALPITVLCAAGSWFLVERPALRFKARRVSKRPMAEDLDPGRSRQRRAALKQGETPAESVP
ncbi:MAG TPA: acyltransferase [Thermoleophilaceae bacterium]|jgi:peptidoglycan/LPS O-acetylase OafA/YrhL